VTSIVQRVNAGVIEPLRAYSVEQAAAVLDVTAAHIYRLITARRLKASNIGVGEKPCWRILGQAIVDFLMAGQVAVVDFAMAPASEPENAAPEPIAAPLKKRGRPPKVNSPHPFHLKAEGQDHLEREFERHRQKRRG